ncbi:glycosyltransferase family 4 protein [Aquiflexum sp. TKW24L]|uniref:glycosyltransferase family 4 protein n=1 Tax=Aquiflexum sp. TKW24L TaxID=2942212 RepID=UPI0020C15855|nr:glycosyltransferase family 4 protein [Aquiflexum sp. TKW24L]MCL6259959.1 glycosyltransferase family 4 protein [Aquiflexum sp. TKW24L]
MSKIIRITTVPISLKLLLSGQMKFMKDADWEVIMVSADGREINEIVKKEDCRHEVIPFTRKITPLQDLSCLWQLYNLIKKENPDIVHTHTPKAGLLGMLAAKLAGVKVRIHTVAGLPYMVAEKQKKSLLVNIEKLTYSWATQVWPNSPSLKKFIVDEELVGQEKLKLIGFGSSNGVDLEKFNRGILKENHLVAATMRIMPGDNDFIILAIGRLVKDKGIEEMVSAFLDSKISDRSKLVLLGSFEQELNPVDEEIVRKISDHPRIVQIEWTDHVAHYLALADVLVHPSHREGFPNVLLEAGAMQVPIICSDIIGNTDIVTNKKTGLVFPVKNKEFLKDALEFAYIKRDIMQELADNLFKEVEEKYQRKKMHQLILEEYKNSMRTIEGN